MIVVIYFPPVSSSAFFFRRAGVDRKEQRFLFSPLWGGHAIISKRFDFICSCCSQENEMVRGMKCVINVTTVALVWRNTRVELEEKSMEKINWSVEGVMENSDGGGWKVEGFFLEVRKGPDPTMAQHHAATILLQSNKTPESEKKRKTQRFTVGVFQEFRKSKSPLGAQLCSREFIYLFIAYTMFVDMCRLSTGSNTAHNRQYSRKTVLTLFLSFLALSIWLSITRK